MWYFIMYIYLGEFKEYFIFDGVAIAIYFAIIKLYDVKGVRKDTDKPGDNQKKCSSILLLNKF